MTYNAIDNDTRNVLGKGWTANFLSNAVEGVGNVTIHDGDGYEADFTNSGGSYTPDTGLRRDLSKSGSTITETQRSRGFQRDYDSNHSGRIIHFKDAGGVGYTYNYDGSGNLQSIYFPTARGIYFEYATDVTDPSKHWLVKITDYVGRETYFTYNANDELVAIDAEGCCSHEFGYDGSGRMLSHTDAEGVETGVQYVTSRIDKLDRVGSTTYFMYDQPTSGKTTVPDARGNNWIFTHNADDALDREEDPLGNTIRKAFNSDLALTKIENPLGDATYFGYDSNLNRTRVLDPNRHATYFGYDASNNLTRRQNALLDTAYFEYDAGRRLTKRIDKLGHATTFGYDPTYGSQLRQVDALGQVTYFSYNNYALMVRQQNPLENATEFGYNSRDNLSRVRNALQEVTYFEYDEASRLTKQIDALKRQTIMEYDSRGLEVTRLAPLNTVTYFEYDGLSRRTKQIDPRDDESFFTYDAESNLLKQARQANDTAYITTYFEYDTASRQVRTIDPIGTPTYFGYDAASRNVKTIADIGGLNVTTYFEYDAAGNQTRVIDPRGNATEASYDALNRADVVTDALGNTTLSGFDAVGNLARVVDQRGNTTYFSYDVLNRQTGIADELWLSDPGPGHTTYLEYDANGNQTKQIDQNDHATIFGYDVLNRQEAIEDPAGFSTYFAYDTVGNQKRVQDRRGNATYMVYDDLNRVTQREDSVGIVSRDGYDANGNVTRTSVGSSQQFTYFAYDAADRLTTVQDGQGGVTYYEYDGASNQTRILDPNEHATLFGYDPLSRLAKVLAPDDGAVYFGYDPSGNRVRQQDQRLNVTYFTYDALNRLAEVRDPLDEAIYFGYDANGNLARQINAENSAAYFTYDPRNQKTDVIYDTQGTDVSTGLAAHCYYVYDAVGNVTAMGDLWGLHQMAYDGRNLLTRHIHPMEWTGDGEPLTTYYEYDGNGNVTELAYPGYIYPGTSGSAVAVYDARNRQIRLKSPSDNTTYFEYGTADNPTRRILANGAEQTATYDAAGRVSQWLWKDNMGATELQFDYTRDAKGLPVKVGRENSRTIYYAYDEDDRLTDEVWVDDGTPPTEVYAFHYDYDLAGNRTKAKRIGVDTYYFYNEANQLTVRGTDAAYADPAYYYYDKNGSLTTLDEPDGVTYFTYNAAGMVDKIVWKDQSTHQFFYDGNLQRYAMVDSVGNTWYFIWDGLNLLQETTSSGWAMHQYTNAANSGGVAGIGQLVEAKFSTNNHQYPMMDPRGTIMRWGTGGSTSREYDAFGRLISETGVWWILFPTGYQGQTWREITSYDGAQRLGLSPARLYSFDDGIFYSRDPKDWYLDRLIASARGSVLGQWKSKAWSAVSSNVSDLSSDGGDDDSANEVLDDLNTQDDLHPTRSYYGNRRIAFLHHPMNFGHLESIILYEYVAGNPLTAEDSLGLVAGWAKKKRKAGDDCCKKFDKPYRSRGITLNKCIEMCQDPYLHSSLIPAAVGAASVGVATGLWSLGFVIPCYALGTYLECLNLCMQDQCVSWGRWNYKLTTFSRPVGPTGRYHKPRYVPYTAYGWVCE